MFFYKSKGNKKLTPNNNIRGERMKNKKTNPKRIKTMLFLIILLLLITNTSVHAATNDSLLVRNKQDDIFAIAPLSDRVHLYNLEMYTINNIPTYCIEIGKSITSTTYSSTDNQEEQKRITNLTKEQLEYLNLIAYFGYQYQERNTNIHNAREYYMASQELIWEYLNNNLDITWTHEENINGARINIDSYKNNINNLINKYQNSLQLPDAINMTVGDTFTYTDGNLSIYKILQNNNIIGNIANNTLKIETLNNYLGEAKIILDVDSFTNNKTTIYNNGDSQTLLSRGALPSKRKEITINIEGKTLNTYLVDKDTKTNIPQGQAKLEGAEYELYDKNNNLVTTFTTDQTLHNTINNLYNEKYYIKQIKASEGYLINDQVVEVDLSKTDTVVLEEKVITCELEILKLYEVEGKEFREENITFSIHFFKESTGYYGSLTTTKEGPDKITLPYGRYRITQENTTYGYEKANTVYISARGTENMTYKLRLVNKQIKTKLNIITLDKDTQENIKEANIGYKIKDSNNNYLTYKTNDNETDTYYTGDDGEVTLPFSIPYGTYKIEQVSSPTNYLSNDEVITIVIDENGNYINDNNQLLINVEYYNEKKIEPEPIITGDEITPTNEEEIIIPTLTNNIIPIPDTLSNNNKLPIILLLVGVILYKKIINIITNTIIISKNKH